MGPFRRAVIVVCDGLGVGAAPDAAAFGDEGSDTLGHVLAAGDVKIPHLRALGLGNLTPSFDGARYPNPEGAFGKMAAHTPSTSSGLGSSEPQSKRFAARRPMFWALPGGRAFTRWPNCSIQASID